MRKLTLLVGVVLLVVGGSSAAGKPGSNPCSGGALASGTYGGFTVSGTCLVDFQAQVTINGNLALADGAVFRGMFLPGTVRVTGNVNVGKGALLGLGYGTTAEVNGNIIANQPKSLYLGGVTVHGNVISNGGGTAARFYNFPIKDNTIGGNLVIHGWQGGWWGVIANTVHGNVDLANNTSVVQPAEECEGTFPNGCQAAPGPDLDSSEVQSRADDPTTPNINEAVPQHIFGNLICHGNTPKAQINFADGGLPNIVNGNKIGECAGL